MAIATEVVQERKEVHRINLKDILAEHAPGCLQDSIDALVDGDAVSALLNDRGDSQRECRLQFGQDDGVDPLCRARRLVTHDGLERPFLQVRCSLKLVFSPTFTQFRFKAANVAIRGRRHIVLQLR